MWEGVAIDKLTLFSAKVLPEPGRYGDGDGLYPLISPSGSKSWVRRIVIDGRHRNIGFGSCPVVRLDQARWRPPIALPSPRGGTPCPKGRPIEAARIPVPSVPTFAQAAARVIEIRRPALSNPIHTAQ